MKSPKFTISILRRCFSARQPLSQLPLSLLKAAVNQPMLVELKNGETYNGHLVGCDTYMNIHLREVICTSRDGDRFWKMPECYVRGSTIKYLRIPDDVIGKVREDQIAARMRQQQQNQWQQKRPAVGGHDSRGGSAGRFQQNQRGGRGGSAGGRGGQNSKAGRGGGGSRGGR